MFCFIVFAKFLKLADLYFYKKASHWITINYPMLAYVRKFTYLSAA